MAQSPTISEVDRSEIASISDSEYHRLLSSERRRILLDILADQGESLDLATVAKAIADRETSPDCAGSETVNRVSITLHHSHLPLMDEIGILDYDPSDKTVDVHPDRLPV